MAEVLSPSYVTHNPKNIICVIEVTLSQISSWLMYRLPDLPEHLMQHVRDLDLLREELEPLYREMQDGDGLWLCRSDQIGPLHGHEGIALVRDGRPLVYIRVVQY